MPDDTYFTIAQQTGPRRSVRMAARGGPLAGSVTFGVMMRREKTLYAGSPDASFQVQGPDEKNWSPNGHWEDRYMVGPNPTLVALLNTGGGAQSQGTQARTAVQLAQFLALICREGQIVRVSYGPEVRYGLLFDFDWTPSPTLDCVDWKAEFEFGSRSGDPALPSAPQRLGGQDFTSQLSLIVDGLADLTDTVQNLPSSIPLDFSALQTMRAGVAQLGRLRDAAYQTMGSFADNVQGAVDVAQSLLSTGAQAMTDAADLADFTQRTSYRTLTGVADLGSVTAGQYVAAAAYARQVGSKAREIEDLGQDFITTAETSFTSDVQAVIEVKTGQDLRSIAALPPAQGGYGNANQWRDIAAYNGLRGPGDVIPGDRVFVPRVTV